MIFVLFSKFLVRIRDDFQSPYMSDMKPEFLFIFLVFFIYLYVFAIALYVCLKSLSNFLVETFMEVIIDSHIITQCTFFSPMVTICETLQYHNQSDIDNSTYFIQNFQILLVLICMCVFSSPPIYSPPVFSDLWVHVCTNTIENSCITSGIPRVDL